MTRDQSLTEWIGEASDDLTLFNGGVFVGRVRGVTVLVAFDPSERHAPNQASAGKLQALAAISRALGSEPALRDALKDPDLLAITGGP